MPDFLCGHIGAGTYLSPWYDDRVIDIQIIRESGFISAKYHYPEDQLLL